ncbi:MAG: hypothetical protein HC905_27160 [Bacteroidales bacterium]|nr:hypothetical protein [Bacteroidales bacterium]
MKTKIFKILLLTSLSLVSIKALAIKEEFSKVIKKEYQINSRSELEINNKYGNVHIQNWEENSFKIEVKITVDVKDNSRQMICWIC